MKYTHCTSCGRKFRHGHTKAADAPGTVASTSSGVCRSCIHKEKKAAGNEPVRMADGSTEIEWMLRDARERRAADERRYSRGKQGATP
ncbi:hypothetical protein [Arthrobacter woluwensis]|uniref:hypothetical protein n=1 Tax=Arthrobacter woluwensis TaxID=156980 RepID=UPI003821A6B8